MKKIKFKKKETIIIGSILLIIVLTIGYFTYKRMGHTSNRVYLDCSSLYPSVGEKRYYLTADYKWKGTTKIKTKFIMRYEGVEFKNKVPTEYGNPVQIGTNKYLIFIYNMTDTIIINRQNLYMHKFKRHPFKQIKKEIFNNDKIKDSLIDKYLKELGTPEENYSYKKFLKNSREWGDQLSSLVWSNELDTYKSIVPMPSVRTGENYEKWRNKEWRARFPYWTSRDHPNAYILETFGQIQMLQCKKTKPKKIKKQI